MAVALNLTQQTHILECDRDLPEDKQTRFLIRPMSAKQNAAIQDSMKFTQSDKGMAMDNIGSHTLDIVKCGLMGWENFLDAEGNQIKFVKNMDDNLDKLAVEYRYELASAIMELSNLGTDKEKN